MHEESEQTTRLTQTAPFRAALLLLIVVIVFLIVRQMAVPKSFGQYGYYRGDNVEEWISYNQNYASGKDDCSKCHGQEFTATAQDVHNGIDCQSCHGPLAAHVKNPQESRPKVAGNAELCGACHKDLLGRKEKIPTVKLGEHSGGLECTRCHDPHQPWAKIGGRQQ